MRSAALISLLAALLAGGLRAQDQQYNDDAEVRAHIDVEASLSKKWSVHLDQQYRFGNNVSNLTRASYDLGVGYKVSKHVRLVADYRLIQSHKNAGYYATRHWYSGALVLRTSLDRWKFVYRNLVQFRNGDMNSEGQYLTRIYDRNKITVRFEATKRWTYYTAHEAYIPLNNPQITGIDRTRHYLGTLYRISRRQQIEFYFLYQPYWQQSDWWDQTDRYPSRYMKRDFIYGIGYSIEI